jgi:hypothetical protein
VCLYSVHKPETSAGAPLKSVRMVYLWRSKPASSSEQTSTEIRWTAIDKQFR